MAFGAGSALPVSGSTMAMGAGGGEPAGTNTATAGSSDTKATAADADRDTRAASRSIERSSRAQTRSAAPKPKATNVWVKPAKGPLTSTFGARWGTVHQGVDIAAGMGSPMKAAKGGVVKIARWYGGYGNFVEIDHGNGITTRYGHNSKLLVSEGQKVTAGETVALVGSTGDSTGPHAHFEVRVDGTAVDPIPYLKERGLDLTAEGQNNSL